MVKRMENRWHRCPLWPSRYIPETANSIILRFQDRVARQFVYFMAGFDQELPRKVLDKTICRSTPNCQDRRARRQNGSGKRRCCGSWPASTRNITGKWSPRARGSATRNRSPHLDATKGTCARHVMLGVAKQKAILVATTAGDELFRRERRRDDQCRTRSEAAAHVG